MNTLNETGAQAGRFLYRSHETLTNGAVSVTDLETGATRVLVPRADWNRMDGIPWTPWRTLLTAEEMRPERQPSTPDRMVPQVLAGLLYEVDPASKPRSKPYASQASRIAPQRRAAPISTRAERSCSPTCCTAADPPPGTLA